VSTNALVRVKQYARPHLRGLGFSLAAGIAMMGVGLAIAPITGRAVDALENDDFHRAVMLGLGVIAIGILESSFAYTRRYVAARASIAMEQDMRDTLYAKLQRLPIAFHDDWQSGQLLSRAMGDLGTIRRFIGFGLMFLFINALQFLGVMFLMARAQPSLALVTIAVALPVMYSTWRFHRRYHDISRRVQDNAGDMTTVVEEAATGIRIIKAFGRGAHMADVFRKQADVVHSSSMEAVRLRAMFWMILGLLPSINLALILALGGRAVAHGTMSIGDVTKFIIYLLQLMWPIRSMGWILANGEEARTAAERFFEVIDTPEDITDRPGARPVADIVGRVRFANVSFRYPSSSDWILRNVNLEIMPGETLAIVGTTGSGKTTLTSLVPRLYDVTEGSVMLDDIDVRDLTLSSLRSHIGVAFEDPVLFSMSVRENLLLAGEERSEEQIRSALETAHATFVYDLPWGLDTRIGEQGYSLSGGQRQRLALARAVLGRPQVLVLDDPLSAVDVHTEAQIEAALASVLQGVTALLVVHRPSTLALADRVALLHEGTIAAVGTHSELMRTEPRYRDILSQEAEDRELASASGEQETRS
jgi:ATP-binding cassette, subfamily B, bacterial